MPLIETDGRAARLCKPFGCLGPAIRRAHPVTYESFEAILLQARRYIILVLAGLIMIASPSGGGMAAERIRLGVLGYLGAEHSMEEWAPTIHALRAALPDANIEFESFDHSGLAQGLADGNLDFVVTNPGHYVELELRYGISRIATRESDVPVASTIVAPAGANAIATLADLRGKRLAIVGQTAFGGFQVAWREFFEAGIDPFTDLRLVPVGLPMTNVIAAIQDGRADAGIIRGCLLEQRRAQMPELKVVAPIPLAGSNCIVSSRAYPDWPFSKAKATSPLLAKRVATVLLNYGGDAGIGGWTVPVDYQPVHDLFRTLKIAPYEHLRQDPLVDLLQRYWQYLALVLLVFVAWLSHVVRVEALVRRRTSELAAANSGLQMEMEARRIAEERDALHQRELEHAGRLSVLGEMASGLAHELNQPLTAITNYADGCAMRLNADTIDPAELREATQRIREQAVRASAVIRQMRTFARKREPDCVVLNINEVVGETIALFEGPVRRAGGRIHLDLADHLPFIMADRIQIQQVLLNLLQNAMDAERAISDTVSEIHVATSSEAGGISVQVTDRGVGLSEEARAHLFEPFFTTKPQGLGLGLALCRSIVDEHGGRLSARSNPNRGTTMTLWLNVQDKR